MLKVHDDLAIDDLLAIDNSWLSTEVLSEMVDSKDLRGMANNSGDLTGVVGDADPPADIHDVGCIAGTVDDFDAITGVVNSSDSCIDCSKLVDGSNVGAELMIVDDSNGSLISLYELDDR